MNTSKSDLVNLQNHTQKVTFKLKPEKDTDSHFFIIV